MLRVGRASAAARQGGDGGHATVLITAASLILVAGVVLAVPADAGRGSAAQLPAARSVQADFNQDGTDDLAVGVPFEDVGNAADAGAVSVLPGWPGGLTTSGGRLFTQNTSGIPGAAELGDQFGTALTSSDMPA
jgi:FG-GAP repeat